MGLTTRVTRGRAMYNGEPERDLRMYGYEPPSPDSGLRLVISNPSSIWGRAGLHSRDRLVGLNGMPVRPWSALRAKLQDVRFRETVHVPVQRSAPAPFA